ncbi:hypothetical protein CISIN_1g034557mg [Citrus sinensis]|uniref:Uncharacterized protein n=1 Tax=Citrus sinensis TaxID=2711 RepID=A0A067FU37_CITSI|nr:hypothetical protein CISIN_1g034557mg [Citrus sinensis]
MKCCQPDRIIIGSGEIRSDPTTRTGWLKEESKQPSLITAHMHPATSSQAPVTPQSTGLQTTRYTASHTTHVYGTHHRDGGTKPVEIEAQKQ